MKFSLLHSSARPGKWEEIYRAWIEAADHPEEVEYVLVGDERWGFKRAIPYEYESTRTRPWDKYILNAGRRCYVEGVNIAASISTGDVLIVNADDQYPAPHWDSLLAHEIEVQGQTEFVLWAPTGTTSEGPRGICPMPIVSRARYTKLGYLLYPGYESMYADNDLHDHAQRDGVLINALDSLPTFPHRHPLMGTAEMDEAYKAQNRQEAYTRGQRLLEDRRSCGFKSIEIPSPGVLGPNHAGTPIKPGKPSLAILLPGETFHRDWVRNWTGVFADLKERFNLTYSGAGLEISFAYSSNVHVTRGMMLKQLVDAPVQPDYVLWIDDDNLPTIQQILTLHQDLIDHPEIDGAAGWSWLWRDGHWYLSAGHLSLNGMASLLTPGEVFARPGPDGDLWQVDWTGFPTFLMRWSAVEKAGRNPFVPILVPAHEMGFCGEDVAFCRNAAERGHATFIVDRRVKVPHLKMGIMEPPESYLNRNKKPAEVSPDTVAV